LFELTECRRTGTVEEYANRFQALLPHEGRLDEAQRVQLFTGGLLPPLSHAVRIHNRAMLTAAMSLARQVELMEIDKMAHATTRAGPRAPPTAPGPRPAPALLVAPALPALPAPLALPAPPVRGALASAKRLTPDEQAERHRLGLCYNCNEPYSRGHNRVCRRIFYIGGMEIADDAPAVGDANPTNQDAPVFSLRAVADMPICDTMQARVVVGAAAFITLLDTGSIHNFIAEDAARRTGLAVHADPCLTATVANDDRISCPGVLRQAPISIAGEEFRVDLYIMPLAGYDLVLGT
jgi:hypothetical protein